MPDMRTLLLALLACASCGGQRAASSQVPMAAPPPEVRATAPDEKAPPPWSAARVELAALPPVYLGEWQRAGNRGRCPLLVATDLGAGGGAIPRRADFGTGWAVAYDREGLPGTSAAGAACGDCGRSVFGVAGTAASPGGAAARDKLVTWSDGSRLFHAAAGGRGELGYLHVAGIECVYHLWSALGEEHLLTVVRGLRRVEGM
jgi:hypothetical protein